MLWYAPTLQRTGHKPAFVCEAVRFAIAVCRSSRAETTNCCITATGYPHLGTGTPRAAKPCPGSPRQIGAGTTCAAKPCPGSPARAKFGPWKHVCFTRFGVPFSQPSRGHRRIGNRTPRARNEVAGRSRSIPGSIASSTNFGGPNGPQPHQISIRRRPQLWWMGHPWYGSRALPARSAEGKRAIGRYSNGPQDL